MKTTISFISLVLLLAGLNYYGKQSDSPKDFICPIHITYKVPRPPITGDNGEVPTTPEYMALWARFNAESPLITTASWTLAQVAPAKPNPAKPNPAKPNPAKPKVAVIVN